jgi:uncharacterized protein YndB with AHSA1/START domain
LSITSVDRDDENLTVAVIADFKAPVERVWELWADPRQLERWWGPPGYPATVEKHDLTAGGEVRYFMIGPEGERHRGIWRVTAVNPPSSLEFADVFADTDGTPIADMPVIRVSVQMAERDGGTRMEMRSKFESREALEKWLGTGTLEGQQQAIAQMDVLLLGP